MPGLKIDEVINYRNKYQYKDIDVFIETGTFLSETILRMRAVFDICHTIEASESLFKRNLELYSGAKIKFHLGESHLVLREIIKDLDEAAIFFLDAHWYKAKENVYEGLKKPLYQELEVLSKRRGYYDIIIVDDLKCFGKKLGDVDWTDISKNQILTKLGMDTIEDVLEKEDKLIIYRGSPKTSYKKKIKVNLVYDLGQYRLCLDPIRNELYRRGHSFVSSKNGPTKDKEVDCSILIQAPHPIPGSKRPRVFIQHGLSCIKGWDNNQDIDYLISPGPYWAEELEKRNNKDTRRNKYKILRIS